MIPPTVVLGGTPKRMLTKDRTDALMALRASLLLLSKLRPCESEYPALFGKACEQHDRRMDLLLGLIEELQEEVRVLDRGEL